MRRVGIGRLSKVFPTRVGVNLEAAGASAATLAYSPRVWG